MRVETILQHQTADVAILRVGKHQPADVDGFWNAVSNWSMGEDFFAYGYPADPIGPNATAPTARLFKGHYHRFMDHRSFMGYSYLAGEMSIAAPAGLSGGPLFRPEAPPMVTALVAENRASQLVVDSIEERTADGAVVKTELRQNVISYGTAVMLSAISDWLDAEIPPRTFGR